MSGHTGSAACVFPLCVDGEKPPHCGNCEGRETPYAHEYGESAASTRVLRWLAAWVESGLWTVEHYASEAADRLNCWRTR